jgi:hypothetical protein
MYRLPCPFEEDVFEYYMSRLDWKLPHNVRVAHSGTASEKVLCSYPIISPNMDTFTEKRYGVQLIQPGKEPVRVIRMGLCFPVIETSCGYGRLVKYTPGQDQLIFNEYYPIPYSEAKVFVNRHHRHCSAPQGHKFSIGLLSSGLLTGVIIASHPKARALDDGFTLELTRCCVLEEQENACSKLYSRAIRAGRSMGYRRFVTYTLPTESGSSLRAVGFQFDGLTQARPKGWDHPARPRTMPDKYPTEEKIRWILKK